jgi:type I restriction enzyme S subunit
MIETKPNTKVSALMLLEQLKKERAKLIASKVILDKKDNHIYPIADIPFEIPTHWVWCYLSDISLIQEGPGIRKHQYATSGVQFLTVTNILEGSVDLEKSKKYISKEQYKNYAHFTINKGDIVTACSGGSWGKSAIYDLDDKLILNTSTLRLRFYNDLGDNYYLYYLTKTNYFKDSLSSYVTGQQPNYGYSHYSKIPIPLPPLSEQQSIVATLDEAFTAIAKAKANAEQNFKNAKELFESYLQGVFENKGKDWEEKKLIEITNKIGSGATPRGGNESYKSEGISLVRSMNVHDFEFREKNLAFIDDQQAKELNNVTLQENDVLLNITGASVARCCVIPKEYLPARVNQHVSIIRAKKEIIDPIFLNLLLTSKFYKDQLLFTGEQGATRQAITKAQLEVFKIAFPKSIKEQKSLMNKLEALSTETKKLEAIYIQKINDLEELKKSVLQKAFSGGLKTTKALV